MNKLLTILSSATILTGCTAPGRVTPATVAPVAAQQSAPVPPTSAPTRPSFVWLDYPAATPIEVIAVLEISGESNPKAIAALELQAKAYGADGLLRLPQDAISRTDLAHAVIAPSITTRGSPATWKSFRFAAFRFLNTSVFLEGYFDDISHQFVSGEETSLYRFAPGRSYAHFGRHVRSPFAADRPPVSVIGVPDGAAVVCPYTNRVFQLW